MCDTLPDPEGGSVELPAERTVGSEATYSCDDGYELSDEVTRTCMEDMFWSGIAPTCSCKSLAGD